jgi:hypothetical protein
VQPSDKTVSFQFLYGSSPNPSADRRKKKRKETVLLVGFAYTQIVAVRYTQKFKKLLKSIASNLKKYRKKNGALPEAVNPMRWVSGTLVGVITDPSFQFVFPI